MKKKGLFIASVGLAGLAVSSSLFLRAQPIRPASVRADGDMVTIYCYSETYNHAHMWKDGGPGTEWPGLEMQNHDGFKTVTFDKSKLPYEKIVFNTDGDNATKTGDLIIPYDYPYYYPGVTWASAPLSAGVYYMGAFSNNCINPATQAMSEAADENYTYELLENVSLINGDAKAVKLSTNLSGRLVGNWLTVNSYKQEYGTLHLPDPNTSNSDTPNVYDNGLGLYFPDGGTWYADVCVKISKSDGHPGYMFSDASNVQVSIDGGEEQKLTTSPTNFNKPSKAFSGVDSDADIDITGLPEDAAISSSKFNNYRDGKVIVGGDIAVEYDKTEKRAFVTGYSELVTYSEEFLTSTIDGEDKCANPADIVYSGETDLWEHLEEDFADLSPDQIEHFYGLTNSVDYEAPSFTDDVEQAAARYCYLRHKYTGLKDFVAIANDPNPSPAKIVPIVSTSNEYTAPLVTLCASLGIIGVIGGAIFIRKRHF